MHLVIRAYGHTSAPKVRVRRTNNSSGAQQVSRLLSRSADRLYTHSRGERCLFRSTVCPGKQACGTLAQTSCLSASRSGRSGAAVQTLRRLSVPVLEVLARFVSRCFEVLQVPQVLEALRSG